MCGARRVFLHQPSPHDRPDTLTLTLSHGRVLCTTLQTTDSRSDHVRRPVAPPLWIPAFAGMTVVMHSTHGRERGPTSSPRS